MFDWRMMNGNNLYFQVRSVDVYRTVFELKTKLESMVKIPANRMRLFYVDQVSCFVLY